MVRLTFTRLLCTAVFSFIFLLLVPISNLLLHGDRAFDILLDRPPARANAPSREVSFGRECAPFMAGGMQHVTVVLKLSAADVVSKLPAHWNRLARCKPRLLFFSDRKAVYNGFDIVDALGNLRPEYKYHNPDFNVSDRMQHANITDDVEAWRLDRYMLLPMMELTSHLRPDSQWYVFVELDTYINWDNLYRFLLYFNPTTPYYFGSPVWPRTKKPAVAHGGSGFVLSRGTMSKLMARGRMFARNHHFPGTHLFGKDVSRECHGWSDEMRCGDKILAQVLKDAGISLRGYWPMFNAEKPSTLRFGREQWCEALISLSTLQEEDFTAMQHWESARVHPSQPLTFGELFSYIEPSLQAQTEDWSNMSEDITYTGGPAGISSESCRAACVRTTKCMQYEHSGDTCRLSHDIRLGNRQVPEGGKKWTSGWVVERIGAFKAAHAPCEGAHFVHAYP
ncbi:glycosyltransferase family 31 protein [Karstenula rhodostoma CBS 690.94]|uniref:N-acetylgalactosaminide beta-1,3-galactosyltransferase n=1 Tax=Karstenula rhodostoma CBS 690.94 TaxID=1392251 RepID=A0A9P4PSA2_9PLEO|nr:glycosyltransferase family 31 protein [Karstenula rhodostoma CBS 690.94]